MVWRRRPPGRSLERDAAPLFLVPDQMAAFAQSVRRHDQGEISGNADRADDIQCSARLRHVSNGAVDSAAVELDRCGFQHSVSGGNSFLFHGCRIAPDHASDKNTPGRNTSLSKNSAKIESAFDSNCNDLPGRRGSMGARVAALAPWPGLQCFSIGLKVPSA